MDTVNEDFIDLVVTNLKILGMLQINDKLIVRRGHLHIDKESGILFIKRWFMGDSRDQALNYISSVIKNINLLFNKLKILLPSGQNVYTSDDIKWILTRILTEMEKAEGGLINLKTTYTEDTFTTVIIENILTKMRELCVQGRNILMELE
jgi:hypothetical protein